ncbi:hypothetical protein NL676_034942 [Syzygium grande]|nr:hypothetical protein NL676_034942 [Syzygium grande]
MQRFRREIMKTARQNFQESAPAAMGSIRQDLYKISLTEFGTPSLNKAEENRAFTCSVAAKLQPGRQEEDDVENRRPSDGNSNKKGITEQDDDR